MSAKAPSDSGSCAVFKKVEKLNRQQSKKRKRDKEALESLASPLVGDSTRGRARSSFPPDYALHDKDPANWQHNFQLSMRNKRRRRLSVTCGVGGPPVGDFWLFHRTVPVNEVRDPLAAVYAAPIHRAVNMAYIRQAAVQVLSQLRALEPGKTSIFRCTLDFETQTFWFESLIFAVVDNEDPRLLYAASIPSSATRTRLCWQSPTQASGSVVVNLPFPPNSAGFQFVATWNFDRQFYSPPIRHALRSNGSELTDNLIEIINSFLDCCCL